MKRIAFVMALALVATACSGDDSGETSATTTRSGVATTVTTTTATTGTDSVDATTTTGGGAADTTTTTGAADTTTTTGASGTTTTSTATSTTATTPAAAPATFVISRVLFGSEGYVAVTNVGGSAGSLEGWQLCQRPGYYGIGPVDVAPGETVRFTSGPVAGLTGQVIDAGGRFGQLSAGGGEIGLYVDNNFGSASSIRSYVEWGSSGHGRSSVAVEAGIWVAGGFVRSEGVPGLAATVAIPTAPTDWATS